MEATGALTKRRPMAERERNQLGQTMGAKGLQTRRTLLDATQALLQTAPLRELSVAQIVRAAKTSTSTFYIYFNDVTEAVLALVAEISQSPPALVSLLASPWAAGDDLERARAFVADYVAHWQAHAPVFRVRNLASDEGDPRFITLRLDAVAPLIEVIAERIEARKAAGRLPQDLEPRSGAGALLALIERISVRWFMPEAEGVTHDRMIDVAAFLVVLALGQDDVLAIGGPAAPPGPTIEATSCPEAEAAEARRNQQGQMMGPKGVRTRARIMAAALELLSTKALRDCSVSDIARSAGLSASTFYLYFEDVPDVVLAMIEDHSQSTPELLALLDEIAQGGDPDALVVRFVELYARDWQANAALFRVRNLTADEGDERFVEVRARQAQPLRDRMARLIALAQARGRLPAHLHPASAAGAILAMVERMSGSPNVRADPTITPHMRYRATAFFVAVLLGGWPPDSAVVRSL